MQRDSYRSDFDYVIDGDVLIITDLNYGRLSVTNDIENVIRFINNDLKRESGISIKHYKIIYQDSLGKFDGVFVDVDENFSNFYYIGTKNINDAKILAR